MRAMLFVAAIGCGGSAAQQPKPTPPEIAPAIAIDAGIADASAVAQGPYPEAGAPCMPTGRYKASWDMGSATIKGGTVECREMAGFVPMQNMANLTIDVTDGNLVVHWPNLMTIVSTSQCAFDVSSQGVQGSVVFTDGKGAAVVSFSAGSPNHPEESCSVKDAKASLEHSRW